MWAEAGVLEGWLVSGRGLVEGWSRAGCGVKTPSTRQQTFGSIQSHAQSCIHYVLFKLWRTPLRLLPSSTLGGKASSKLIYCATRPS